MEIELTSHRDDGAWTWRAAGARQPKGVIDAALVTAGSKVGDVLRVEVEVEIDGIEIKHVLPAREKQPLAGLIEIKPERKPVVGVTTSLVGPVDRGRHPRREDGDRPPRRGPTSERPRRESPGRPGAPAQRGGRIAGSSVAAEPERGRRPGGERPARPAREERHEIAAARPGRARPARLTPGRANLDALLETLPPERRPIAEQLAIGGLPAVRRAIAEERSAAQREQRPSSSGDGIVAIAEELLAAVREATWRDRAVASIAQLEQLSLRDLRAAVIGAAPHDDEGRELLRQLREAFDQRVTGLRDKWEKDMTEALEEGRVLQALRLSARLPEPSARFPAALVVPLATAAGAALNAETPGERWMALLEAAAASPIRRSIHPAALPTDDAEGSARQAAVAAAGRVPSLAKLLGLAMPPPPRPVAAGSRPRIAPPRRLAPPRPTVANTAPTATAPAAEVPAVAAPAADGPTTATAGESAPVADAPTTATGPRSEPVADAPPTEQAAVDAGVAAAPEREASDDTATGADEPAVGGEEQPEAPPSQ